MACNELATPLAATNRGSNSERKSADGDGGDGDNRTPDEGRSGRGETRRDAGVMPVHESGGPPARRVTRPKRTEREQ